MNDPVKDDELRRLVAPEDLGKMVTQWAKDNGHRLRARLEIVFEADRYAIRMFEEAWGMRIVTAPPKLEELPGQEKPA